MRRQVQTASKLLPGVFLVLRDSSGQDAGRRAFTKNVGSLQLRALDTSQGPQTSRELALGRGNALSLSVLSVLGVAAAALQPAFAAEDAAPEAPAALGPAPADFGLNLSDLLEPFSIAPIDPTSLYPASCEKQEEGLIYLSRVSARWTVDAHWTETIERLAAGISLDSANGICKFNHSI
eukprot:gene27390-33081_t